MLWETWQRDYAPPIQVETTESFVTTSQNLEDLPESLPEIRTDLLEEIAQPPLSEPFISVKTDVLEAKIALKGGTFKELILLEYPIDKLTPERKVNLLYEYNSNDFYIAQSGLLSQQGGPDHTALYQADKLDYVLDAQEESLEVKLYWYTPEDIEVVKVLRFHKGSYLVDIVYQIKNKGILDWSGSLYGQLQRTRLPAKSMHSYTNYTYTGAVVSSPENRYEKLSFDDIEEERLSQNAKDGWVAMLQHYFLSAFIPKDVENRYRYYTKFVKQHQAYLIGAVSPAVLVPSGTEKTLAHRFYFGPKIQSRLNDIASGLDLTVDYGIFWFIAKPLFWLLNKFQLLTGNWGMAIILLTALIKLLFYRLSAAAYRSMANLRRLQPRLVALRERYKDNKQGLNQAMMEMYRTEKINPLGGCLPILVQIPVFFSLYWVLLESVEMRQAEFALWIDNLSAPDPFFVLPILMGLTMFIQQKLSPAPMDPIQEKIMSFLPLLFTIFFVFFPAGLVLYWVVNNILSIIQQWWITRCLEKAG